MAITSAITFMRDNLTDPVHRLGVRRNGVVFYRTVGGNLYELDEAEVAILARYQFKPRLTPELAGCPTPKPVAQIIETAPPGIQVLAHEPLYGWLIVSKQLDGTFLQKSSGNFWADVPQSVQFTHWLPYPGDFDVGETPPPQSSLAGNVRHEYDPIAGKMRYFGSSAPNGWLGWENEEKITVEQAWTILCETPDITSPEEYPDHALITMEQLGSFMARANDFPPEGFALVPLKMNAAMINAWSGGTTVTTDEIAYRTTFQDAWCRVLAAALATSEASDA